MHQGSPMRNRTAIRNYRVALANEQSAPHLTAAFVPRSGAMAVINNWYPSTKTTLGDMDGPLEDIGIGVMKIVDTKTKRLENALTLIIGLSGIAAITGIASLIKR